MSKLLECVLLMKSKDYLNAFAEINASIWRKHLSNVAKFTAKPQKNHLSYQKSLQTAPFDPNHTFSPNLTLFELDVLSSFYSK